MLTQCKREAARARRCGFLRHFVWFTLWHQHVVSSLPPSLSVYLYLRCLESRDRSQTRFAVGPQNAEAEPDDKFNCSPRLKKKKPGSGRAPLGTVGHVLGRISFWLWGFVICCLDSIEPHLSAFAWKGGNSCGLLQLYRRGVESEEVRTWTWESKHANPPAREDTITLVCRTPLKFCSSAKIYMLLLISNRGLNKLKVLFLDA